MKKLYFQPQLNKSGILLDRGLWILQILIALMFLIAGFSKLSGVEQMVATFEKIGLGQWFRYATGGIEILSAILLLIPRPAGFGALLLVATMAGATFTHLFVIGGSPAVPIVLMIMAAVIVWGRGPYRRQHF